MSDAFGKHLRNLRRMSGVSQRELALHVNCDFTHISKIEGGSHYASYNLVKRIAEYFGEDVDRMLLLADHTPQDIVDIFKKQPELLEQVRAKHNFLRAYGERVQQTMETKGFVETLLELEEGRGVQV